MVLVRSRSPADLRLCVEALHEVHESDDYPHRWPLDPVSWLTPENMAAAWVAEQGNRIVGHVVIVDNPGALWVSRLFVRPGHRGSLVGDALLRQARIGGASMLDVIERSSKAIELYERTGWSLVDRRPANWIMSDGRRPVERIYRADAYSTERSNVEAFAAQSNVGPVVHDRGHSMRQRKETIMSTEPEAGSSVTVVVSHTTLPNQREAVRALWEKHMAPAVLHNPGHLAYYYCLDSDDPARITAFQHYRTAEDARTFLQHPAYRAYEREVAPLLAGAPQVRTLVPTWIKPAQ